MAANEQEPPPFQRLARDADGRISGRDGAAIRIAFASFATEIALRAGIQAPHPADGDPTEALHLTDDFDLVGQRDHFLQRFGIDFLTYIPDPGQHDTAPPTSD